MTRGVTQADVWQAADAILLEGARPTIARVRQKLGRGSPNTVSPHLDTWFRKLGSRIRDPLAYAAPPDVPEPVLQAAKYFWDTALAHTREDFDERLRAALSDAVANVEAEKERAAQAAASAFDATGRARRLDAERAAMIRSLDDERRARAATQAQLEEARRDVAALTARLQSAAGHAPSKPGPTRR